MKTESRVYGADEMRGLLRERTPREAHNLLRSTVHGMAGALRDDMRRDAPRSSGRRSPLSLKYGHLFKNIKSKRARARIGEMPTSNVVVENSVYWEFLEYGNSRQAAQPFIMPTVEKFMGSAKDTFLTQFGKKLEAAIARAKRRGAGGR